MRRLSPLPVLAVVTVAAAMLAGCSSSSSSSTAPAASTTPSESASSAAPSASETPSASASETNSAAALQTLTPGTLTIGTGNPAYFPWVIDDKPESKKGFEAAVAYAVAEKLGFTDAQVSWVRTTFDAAVAPGTKNFDFNLQQYSITDERKKAVDFSSGYYTVTQAVVSYKGSPIEKATDIAGLKGAQLGAQVGTTSVDAIKAQIAPTKEPRIYKTNDLAVQALKTKQIDGLVVDLPTAFYVAGAVLDNGVIVGQLPASGGKPEEFGLVLAKDSPLTAAVTEAVDALRADGTLDQIAKTWLAEGGAPELS